MKKQILCILLACIALVKINAEETSAPPFSTIGTITPQYASSLSSAVTGRIQEVLVDISSEVKKGQPLLTIDPLFFRIDVSYAEAELASARVDLSDAELNYQRMSKLWNKPDGVSPSIPKKKFEDAQVRFEQEKARVQEAEETLKRAQAMLDEATLKAPYDGIITKRYVHPGEWITSNSDTKLLEIESLNKVYLEFSIPQPAKNNIHLGSRLTFEIDGIANDPREAFIDLISPHVDEKTRSIKCRATIDNRDKTLSSGAFVRIHIYPEQPHVSL